MKPTDNEVETAIVAAEAMRESGADEHHVAKTLLYQYQRLQDLEKIREAAENYLRFGQEEPMHAELVLAIEAARKTELRVTGVEEEDLGLG
ncbi:MAG: hypothetical protein OEU51_10065 [Gammaproteobacteria bacterium]|jgi:hypothetical protein|nr:hypothetical protein [Gammaproteobacteria bacterium]